MRQGRENNQGLPCNVCDCASRAKSLTQETDTGDCSSNTEHITVLFRQHFFPFMLCILREEKSENLPETFPSVT